MKFQTSLVLLSGCRGGAIDYDQASLSAKFLANTANSFLRVVGEFFLGICGCICGVSVNHMWAAQKNARTGRLATKTT